MNLGSTRVLAARAAPGDPSEVSDAGMPVARHRWVTPDVGTAGGTGTIHDPILGIQNAIDSFAAPTNATEEAAENVLHIAGGVYDEAITIPNRFGRWVLYYYGSMQIGTFGVPKGITWVSAPAAYGATGQPSLTLASAAHIPGSGFLTGSLAIGDGGGGGQDTVVVLSDAYVFGTSGVSGAMAGAIGCTAIRTTFNGAVTWPTGDLTFRSCRTIGNMAIRRVQLAHASAWQGTLTVTATPAAGAIGTSAFLNCTIAGNFTGPAGTALFDRFTVDNFGGGFAGGAGAGDYMET